MASRAALVTGGSSGIGKALARVLGQEGHAVTISGRDEAKLAAAAAELRAEGIAVETVAGDVGEEEAVARIVGAHADAHGRMDALVNAAAYAAAKAGVNALTESAQAEARSAGIQFTIFSLGFTATRMSEWTRDAGVAAEEMVAPADLGEGLRFLLRTSPTCLVREIEFSPRRLPDAARRSHTPPNGTRRSPRGCKSAPGCETRRRRAGPWLAGRLRRRFPTVRRTRVWLCNGRGIKASAIHRTPV